MIRAIHRLSIAFCLVLNGQLMAQPPAPLWSRTYSGPANRGDIATGCVVDALGNLFVTGTSGRFLAGRDVLTIRYNPATGDTVWTSRYTDPVFDMLANACAVDRSGNLYAAGETFRGSPRVDDLLLIRYNPVTGAPIWARTFDSGGDDHASGCAVDTSGFIYATGSSNSGGNNDFLVIKYTPSGDTVWTRRFDDQTHGDDQAFGSAVDSSGNLYVTGYSHTGSQYVLLTIKYNPGGDTLWTRRSTDVIDNLAQPFTGCAVDRLGNVYVTGMCGIQSGFGNRYGVTIKYNSSGATLWTSLYDGPTVYDQPIACAVDSRNDLYVVGGSYNGSNDDWLIIKYNSSNGATLWTTTHIGTANLLDYAIGCSLDPSDYLYVTGITNYDSDTTGSYLTIKYQSTVTSVGEFEDHRPTAYRLFQNFPNPFNPSTKIRFSLPLSEFVNLRVFNILGEQIAVLVSENLSAGSHQAEWNPRGLPSGVYFYRLQAGPFMQTKKLLLLR